MTEKTVTVELDAAAVAREWLKHDGSSWHWPIRDNYAQERGRFAELRVTGMGDGLLRFAVSVNGAEVDVVILPWRALFSWQRDLQRVLRGEEPRQVDEELNDRAAHVVVMLHELLEAGNQLEAPALNALRNMCRDAARILDERAKLAGGPGQASGPEEGGP